MLAEARGGLGLGGEGVEEGGVEEHSENLYCGKYAETAEMSGNSCFACGEGEGSHRKHGKHRKVRLRRKVGHKDLTDCLVSLRKSASSNDLLASDCFCLLYLRCSGSVENPFAPVAAPNCT